jgi:hypothetical protein
MAYYYLRVCEQLALKSSYSEINSPREEESSNR